MEEGVNKKSLQVGRVNLADPKQLEETRKLVVKLQLQTEYLIKKDIRTWRNAWQYAINVDYPNRVPLYNVYSDVDVDLHLTGCVGQRNGYVLNKSFRIVDKAKKENPELTSIFESPWFKEFMRLTLEATYWGHSLIQLGDVITVDGIPAFSEVKLVPRKHVKPEYGVIVTRETDTWKDGYDYRHSAMADWVVEVGGTHDLGLFLKCAPQTIPKKNMFTFWDMFGEIFGIPFRVAKTTSRDNKEQSKIEKMLSDMGSAGWALFPEGTDIEIKESTRGDAYNVFDKRIDRANSELSKGVLTQTMTTDNGSSLSQSEIHKEMLENLIGMDADNLRDTVNFKLIPKMIKHGFPLKGFRFDWNEGVDYTPEQQIRYEEMILDRYEVDPKYFAEKYNIPIIKPREQPTTVTVPGGKQQPNTKDTGQKLEYPFFD
ncbi:MAG: DUF935 domain-containing protein [Mediterranea sp.]|jgi:hypothetical protein|nr:DUF935 domain-containing protein [Mediterranea sp.]